MATESCERQRLKLREGSGEAKGRELVVCNAVIVFSLGH